ncbi:hypothetical protein PoB_005657700 [Plakobranchus ocellatus]|uniref:Uncharacterized protein n=1 Tax=Plakobranchus ocellatus TaxID=259542 RepID=A0AAV4CET4_9GAST|nr:hypothetical protein PoB_005657700 [Plakobranchus ocellatus]
MLVAWMADNDSEDWPMGIKFVQFQSSTFRGIKCSLNSATFGCEGRVGLNTSSLPVEMIARMGTEEDLLAVTPIRRSCVLCRKPQSHTTHQRNQNAPSCSSDAQTLQAGRICRSQLKSSIVIVKSIDDTAFHSATAAMVKRSRLDLRASKHGDDVAVPVPLLDRRRGDTDIHNI